MDAQAKEIKLDNSNMWSSVRNGRQVNDLFVQQFSLLYHVNFE
jgi:hypothetical protein